MKNRYPEVKVHEVGERVRSVYGTPMTTAATPRAAVNDWLNAYGEVFADGPMQLVDFRDVPRRNRDGGGAGEMGRVFMYKQTMDGLDVVGSSARLMVDQWRGQSRVLYASARVAVRPEGGLPKPTITASQAIEAAKKHATGQRMTAWSKPQLVAIYDEAPRFGRRAGEAYPAWKCIGGGGAGGPGGGGVTLESYSFYVDAIHGTVTRTHDNIMRFADITGKVTGNATPTDTNATPEILGPDTKPLPTQWSACQTTAVETPLRDVLMMAYDSQTGAFVASTYTDSNGDYTLVIPPEANVDIHAHLSGPGWQVYSDTWNLPPLQALWGVPLAPTVKKNIPWNTSSGDADFLFNKFKTEPGTAYSNVHTQAEKTWYFLDPESLQVELPPAPMIVNHEGQYWPAFFLAPGPVPGFDPLPWPGRIIFGKSSTNLVRVNAAYSTVISHEYTHFYLYNVFGIAISYPAFHEGVADVVAHLVHDTETIGQDFSGCTLSIRTPLSANRQHVDCDPAEHIRGQVISAVWLKILDGMREQYGQSTGWDKTRDLLLEWLPLANPPGPHPTLCNSLDQSASASTLIEILTADDDDGNILNGTPNCLLILDAFNQHGIANEAIPCGESALHGSPGCYADLNISTGKGVLDVFDFLSFQELFLDGSPLACDCDTSTLAGVCDVFDFLCFQAAFAAGCNRE